MTGVVAIIAVRHGETDWNRIRRLQGHTDIALNATGIEQAAALGAALAGERITMVHSSDLARAVATAAPIAAALGLTIVQDARLRERNYGVLEGKTFAEILAQHPDEGERLRTHDAHHRIVGGESQHEFFARVVGAVDDIAMRASERLASTVLIVTHGGVLDMLYRAAFGLPLDAERRCEIPNAVINRLTWDAGRLTVTAWAGRSG